MYWTIGLTQLEMVYKTTTISLNIYLQANKDWMMKLVERHEATKQIHSVVIEAREFQSEYDLSETSVEASDKSPTEIAKKKKVEARQQGLALLKDH